LADDSFSAIATVPANETAMTVNITAESDYSDAL